MGTVLARMTSLSVRFWKMVLATHSIVRGIRMRKASMNVNDGTRSYCLSLLSFSGLLLTAFTVRLVILLFSGNLPQHGDEWSYLEMARGFAGQRPLWREGDFQGFYTDLLAWWAPLQGLVLLPVVWTGNVFIGRLISVLLATLSVWPLYLIARNYFGQKVALVAGLIYSLGPEYAFYASYILSENLACLIGLWAVWFGVNRRPAMSGALWGVCLLSKIAALSWVIVAIPWLFIRSGRRMTATCFGCLVLMILPYSVWNSLRLGYPVLVADTFGYSLYYGNNRWIEPGYNIKMAGNVNLAREELRRDIGSNPNHRDYIRLSETRGLQFIKSHPGLFLVRAVKKVGWMWGPYTFPAMRVDIGEYPFRSRALVLVHGITHLALLGLLVIGMVYTRKTDYAKLILGMIIVTTLGCMVTIGLSRYAYPLMIFGLPLVGYGIVWLFARLLGAVARFTEA